MEYVTHSHRHADHIIPMEAPQELEEVLGVLEAIKDEDIIETFASESGQSKSISKAINNLIDARLTEFGWMAQAPIFQDASYQEQRWRLDFAKGLVSIEVAFNHGEAIAWNLLKPVLASEYNHVRKAIQTRFGIVICATDAMKEAGGFDSAVGTYEKFLRYLMPLQQVLSVPILVVGLKPPESFRIRLTRSGNRRVGQVERLFS